MSFSMSVKSIFSFILFYSKLIKSRHHLVSTCFLLKFNFFYFKLIFSWYFWINCFVVLISKIFFFFLKYYFDDFSRKNKLVNNILDKVLEDLNS